MGAMRAGILWVVRGVWERRRWLLLTMAVAFALGVKARFGWIPLWYLGLAISIPAAGWWTARRQARPVLRWLTVGTALSATLAVCPVPWMVVVGGSPPGNAWRLDGRISIEGRSVDPAGEWYWLTVGRPPIVAELVWSKLTHPATDKTATMRAGPLRQRARWVEPAAAAVGLARGGWQIGSRLEGHVANPTHPGLPGQTVIVAIDGRTFAASNDWSAAIDQMDAGRHTFTTDTGERYSFEGAAFPYLEVETVLVPTRDIDVVVGGWMARTPAGRWYRNLASGSSHGLMVALVAYTYASGDQIGRGLAVAGTGTIRSNGEVGSIRGLVAKAGAARDAGADVLLFPAAQQNELTGFDAGRMVLLPVSTIDEAIAALRARHAEPDV
jgi:hypothetical protein